MLTGAVSQCRALNALCTQVYRLPPAGSGQVARRMLKQSVVEGLVLSLRLMMGALHGLGCRVWV